MRDVLAHGRGLQLDLGNVVLPNGQTFTIAHATGGISGTFFGLNQGAQLTIGLNQFVINYGANGGMDINLISVPEPGAWFSLSSGVALLLGVRRRRRATGDR